MGELGPFAQQGLDQLQAQGPVPLTAWQVFEQADAVLAVAAGLVLGLVVLNAIGALSARLDGVLVLGGLVAGAVVCFRLASPPGSDTPLGSDLLHVAGGAHLALAGAALMTVGGVVAAMGQGSGAQASPPAPAPTLAPHEVKVWDAS